VFPVLSSIETVRPLSCNWLPVSLERKRDVRRRCRVGEQQRFEDCEKTDLYAVFIDCLSGLQMTLT